MMPLSFIGFTIWCIFFSSSKKIRKNPISKPPGYRKEKITGGLADYVPDSVFDKKDLEKGIKVEMEHTNDRTIAKEIAKDHLLEDPRYYDKLEIMEKKKNPLLKKGEKVKSYTSWQDIAKENVSFLALPGPSDRAFLSWEPNTFQANIFITPEEAKNPKNQSVFMPRGMTAGRVLPMGMRTPFEQFYKSAPKSLIAAAQFIVDKDKVEIIFMSTRPGWKKLGLMSALIDAIKDQYKVKEIIYFEPTKDGEKFIKKKGKN